jgi:hypothetical protein
MESETFDFEGPDFEREEEYLADPFEGYSHPHQLQRYRITFQIQQGHSTNCQKHIHLPSTVVFVSQPQDSEKLINQKSNLLKQVFFHSQSRTSSTHRASRIQTTKIQKPLSSTSETFSSLNSINYLTENETSFVLQTIVSQTHLLSNCQSSNLEQLNSNRQLHSDRELIWCGGKTQ